MTTNKTDCIIIVLYNDNKYMLYFVSIFRWVIG